MAEPAMPAPCAVCGGSAFHPVFAGRQWSRTGLYPQAPDPPGGAMTLIVEGCAACGLLRQAAGSEDAVDYADVTRATSGQMPDYAGDILAGLAGLGVGTAELAVEIGANDGSFLRLLRAAGQARLLGIEPSAALAALAAEGGLPMLVMPFGRDLAARIRLQHGPAGAVVCRHTLEHVPDIADMVAGMAALLRPGGVAFVEVPDGDWIVEALAAQEIWDEHLTYFRAGALARLCRNAGLTPVRLERRHFRDTRNLLCWAVRGALPEGIVPTLVRDATGPDDLARFQARWDSFAERLRGAVASAPRPVIGIGAGHAQLNFLNFARLGDAVALLVDDDPRKAGRHAPLARAVPILASGAVLATQHHGTLLRTGFPYPAWQDRLCATLAPRGIGAIDPETFRTCI